MLLSMTGYGAGQVSQDDLHVAVEVRAVNNRYLKLNCRLPDGYAAVEPRIESLVREHVRRGAVQLNVDVKKTPAPEDYQINAELVRQLEAERIRRAKRRQRMQAEIELRAERPEE